MTPTRRIATEFLGAVQNHYASGLRGKTWDEFVNGNTSPMHRVITKCDGAVAEPWWVIFRGNSRPLTVHWSYPDPSNAAELDSRMAFELTREAIGYRHAALAGSAAGDHGSRPAASRAARDRTPLKGRR